MIYGSEPDISFERLDDRGDWQVVATIEIKERPPTRQAPLSVLARCSVVSPPLPARAQNFAVLGVVTPEMRRRLNEMNMARDFSLYHILNDAGSWDDFVREMFHHTLRII